jgi:tRNA modification GTPase
MLEGMPVRFIDTAGLRATDDEAERAGVAWSEEWMSAADVICYLLDATREDTRSRAIADLRLSLDRAAGGRAAIIIAANKADLLQPAERAACAAAGAVPVSALTGDGLADLTSRMAGVARERARGADDDVLVTNARHADCLRRALAFLEAALAALAQGRSEEFLAVDVRGALGALDELIGGVTTDDVLNAIFSRFCIGK